MAQQVNFEVQVQQDGRWSIHARFSGHQKDAAIEEGKQLDQLSNVEAVKVIKEVYDADKGFANEFIVYKSAGLKSSGAGVTATSGGGAPAGPASSRQDSWVEDDRGGGGAGAAVAYDEDGAAESAGGRKGRKGRKKKSTLSGIIVKLLMVILFSICVAALFAVMASEFLGGTSLFGVRIVGNAESNMLIGVFVITFLVSAVGMAVTVMKGVSLDASERRRRPARKPPAKKAGTKAIPGSDAGKKSATGPSGQTMANLDEAMKGIEEFKIDPEAKATEDQATTDRLQVELDKDKGKPEAPSAPAEPEAPAAPAEPEGTPVPVSQAPESPPLSPHAEKQKAYMMDFLGKALDGCQTDKEKMDNFNKFGVNLYLAGACEVLAQTRDVDVLSRTKILADGMSVMGFKKSHAASFADRYEEYLMADSRYMQMFQCGRNAMNLYSTDENSAPRLLDDALTEWNKPKPKEEQTGPITVLFTDIAGSTAMTQALGDAGAQQVVRAHNRIVREALSSNAGKEVKHTGDGIMASFNKTSDGVDAAIQMQRETDIYNQQTPDLPLHLKIGLNAGEPIAEDNDLFGSTVQMSARIVDKAQADEIFVSEVIRGICTGKDYDFINRGGYPMKGFSEDVILFEVVWNNSGAEDEAGPG